jgi:hypothetical protein
VDCRIHNTTPRCIRKPLHLFGIEPLYPTVAALEST